MCTVCVCVGWLVCTCVHCACGFLEEGHSTSGPLGCQPTSLPTSQHLWRANQPAQTIYQPAQLTNQPTLFGSVLHDWCSSISTRQRLRQPRGDPTKVPALCIIPAYRLRGGHHMPRGLFPERMTNGACSLHIANGACSLSALLMMLVRRGWQFVMTGTPPAYEV